MSCWPVLFWFWLFEVAITKTTFHGNVRDIKCWRHNPYIIIAKLLHVLPRFPPFSVKFNPLNNSRRSIVSCFKLGHNRKFMKLWRKTHKPAVVLEPIERLIWLCLSMISYSLYLFWIAYVKSSQWMIKYHQKPLPIH